MADEDLARGVVAGDRPSLARALTQVEDGRAARLMAALGPEPGHARVIGVTGAAGSGKSVLVAALAAELRRRGLTVAVLAVDPSSPFTGGALLGDRVRMGALAGDPGVFIRSMAHRGGSGGLAAATGEAVRVLAAAGFDRVLVETLGAGQDEVAVAEAVHTTVVVLVPGMGDAIQALKAGIIEIADVFALNKSDLPGAAQWEAQLAAVLDLVAADAPGGAWSPPIVRTVATDGSGLGELADALEAHQRHQAAGGAATTRRAAPCEPVTAARSAAAGSAAADTTAARSAAGTVTAPARAPGAQYGHLVVAAGTANEPLAAAIAARLGVSLLERQIFQFDNTNTFVRLDRSVRGADVFWVQPTTAPANDNLMELLIAIDALRRDSAARITAVVPYFGYGRSDKKDQPRVPITARLVADMIAVAGADRVLTMELHAGQIQGFFRIPVDDISARRLLARHTAERVPRSAVVVAPDIGEAKAARNFAQELDLPLAVVEKRRYQDGRPTTALNLIGDVDGLDAIVFDDEIDTGQTMAVAAQLVRRRGARTVTAVATHGVFSPPSVAVLEAAPFDEIVVTNTIAVPPQRRPAGLVQLDVAPVLAEVIGRIHAGQSVGALFDE